MLVFAITRIAPGGPMERALQEAQNVSESGGSSSGGGEGSGGMSEEDIETYEEEYGYDKAIPVAYLQWLGAMPREDLISKKEFRTKESGKLGSDLVKDPAKQCVVILKSTGRQALVDRSGDELKATWVDDPMRSITDDGWRIRVQTIDERKERWAARNKKEIEDAPDNYDDRAIAYRTRFAGLLQGDLRKSFSYGDTVWSMIRSRIPIGIYFGLLTALITYSVCLPLGIVKAIKHRTPVDNLSSILIFLGYSIPGFALGAVLLVNLGARLEWFPMFGLTSDDFQDLSFGGKALDLAHHTVLPLLAYVVGSFAYTTMLMKNNLMDNLSADYVRTAVAKGSSFRRAVFKHAFRNSFIPIATSLGGLISIIVGGSILIESVFDIQGFGLLQYQALLDRDLPVIMGCATLAAALMLIGNILSDIIVAFVDPRVKFN